MGLCCYVASEISKLPKFWPFSIVVEFFWTSPPFRVSSLPKSHVKRGISVTLGSQNAQKNQCFTNPRRIFHSEIKLFNNVHVRICSHLLSVLRCFGSQKMAISAVIASVDPIWASMAQFSRLPASRNVMFSNIFPQPCDSSNIPWYYMWFLSSLRCNICEKANVWHGMSIFSKFHLPGAKKMERLLYKLLSWMNTWMSWNLLGICRLPGLPVARAGRPYDFPVAFSNASPPLQYTGDMDWWQLLSVYVLYIQYVYM